MATKKTIIELTTVGGDKVKVDFDQIGEAGQRALKRIAESATPANASLKAIDSTVSELKSHAGGLAEGLGPIGRVLGDLGNVGLAIGAVAGGVGLAGAAFLAASRNAIDYASGIQDASDRASVHAETLQELRFALGQVGAAQENVDGGLVKFAKNVGDAKEGTGTLVEKLKEHNKELLENIRNSHSQEEALNLIFTAISNTKDATEATALSYAAFGRELGGKVVPALKDGIEAFDKIREGARAAGAVISDELIAKGDAAGDKFAVLANVLRSEFYGALLLAAPQVEGFADDLLRAAVAAGKFLGIFDTGALAGAKGDLVGLGQEIENIRRHIAEIENGPSWEEAAVNRVKTYLFPGTSLLHSLFGDNDEEKLKKLRDQLSKVSEARDKLLIQGPPKPSKLPPLLSDEEKKAAREQASALDDARKKAAALRTEMAAAGGSKLDQDLAKQNAQFDELAKKGPGAAAAINQYRQEALAAVREGSGAKLAADVEKLVQGLETKASTAGLQGTQKDIAELNAKLDEMGKAATENGQLVAGASKTIEEGAKRGAAAITKEADALASLKFDKQIREINDQVALLAPGLTPYEQELLKVKLDLQEMVDAHQITGDKAVEQYERMKGKLGELDEAQKKAAANLVDQFSDALDQVVTGFLTGTRDVKDILGGLRDIGVSIFTDMFKQTIKNKIVYLDSGFRGNLLTDIPNMFSTMATSVLGVTGKLFDAILGQKEGTLDVGLGNLFGGGGANGSTGIDGTAIAAFAAGAGGAAGGGILGSKVGGTAGGIVGALLGKVLLDNAYSVAFNNGQLAPYTAKAVAALSPQLAKALGTTVATSATNAGTSLLSSNLGVVNSGTFGHAASAIDAANAARQGITFEGAGEAASAKLGGTALLGKVGTVLGVIASAYSAYKALSGPGSSDERGIEAGHQIGLGIASIFDAGISKIADTILSKVTGQTFGETIGRVFGLGPSSGAQARRYFGDQVLGSTLSISQLQPNFDPYKSGLTTIDKARAAYPELFAKAGNAAIAFGSVLSASEKTGQSDAKELNFIVETLIDNLGHAGKGGEESVIRIASAMRELGINTEQAGAALVSQLHLQIDEALKAGDTELADRLKVQLSQALQGLVQITHVSTAQMVATLKAGLNEEAKGVFDRMVKAGVDSFDAVTAAGNTAFLAVAGGLSNEMLPAALLVFEAMTQAGITSAEAIAAAFGNIPNVFGEGGLAITPSGQIPPGSTYPKVFGVSGNIPKGSKLVPTPGGTTVLPPPSSGIPAFFIPQGLATGGIVAGPLGAPVLAMVHGGETVLPTHDRQAMADFIRNGPPLPGFAAGGIVPGPLGAPMLATVHGGEAVLSNKDLADLRLELGNLSSAVRGMRRRGASEVRVIAVIPTDRLPAELTRLEKEGRYPQPTAYSVAGRRNSSAAQ